MSHVTSTLALMNTTHTHTHTHTHRYETTIPFVSAALKTHHTKVGGEGSSKLFICTKLRGLVTTGIDDAEEDYAAVLARARCHLTALGLDKVHLLLMHWPG